MSIVKPETDLSTLLRTLKPRLLAPAYVFCTVPPDQEQSCWAHKPLATFQEDEGLSIVVSKTQADDLGWHYDAVHRCITLQVYSSLEAVGLTAAVATTLANAGLGANVIAAKLHDHVLVPEKHAAEALSLLQGLSQSVDQ